jgi:hypothetical protein
MVDARRRYGLDSERVVGDGARTPMQYRDVCGKCGSVRVDQQLGLEPTPEAYVARMVAVFREVRRVLRARRDVLAQHRRQLRRQQRIPPRRAR